MNDQPILTDTGIEAMLARRAGGGAPAGLAAEIALALTGVPEARRPLRSIFAPPVARTPAMRLAWVVAIVGLLLAATVSAIFVGGELLRRSNELAVVPPPPVVPFPSAAPLPSAAPSAAPDAVVTAPIERVNELAFADDGSLWLATAAGVVHWDVATERATLYGQNEGLPTTEAIRTAVAPDGTVWASGGSWVARFDGAWTSYSESGDLAALGVTGDLGGLAVGPDGTAWVAATTADGRAMLLRFDGAWSVTEAPESVGGFASPWALRLEVAADGAIWADPFNGVVVFDGTTWNSYTEASNGLPRMPSLAAVAPDGSAWVELSGEGCVATGPDSETCATPAAGVARFDGTRWTVFTTADGLVDDDAGLFVGSDGTVWAAGGMVTGAVSRFDGTRWITVEVPELAGAHALAAAPDGALWLSSADGLLRYDGATVTRHALPAIDAQPDLPPLVLTPESGPTTSGSALGTITWRVYEASPGHNLWSMASTAHGPVVLDGPDLRWVTAAGTWEGTTLPIEPWRVTAVGDDLIAHGQGAVRLSWNGARWAAGETLDVPIVFVEQIAAGPRGTVAAGGTRVAYSTDGQHFRAAERGPDPATLMADWKDSESAVGCDSSSFGSWPGEGTIGPLLATRDGFVALTPANPANWNNSPLCEPVLWRSEDGSTWKLVSATSPFGKGAIVQDVETRGDRHVAVGMWQQKMATWVSDDGLTWERLPTLERAEQCGRVNGTPLCSELLALATSGISGWAIVGWDGAAWTSRDGRTWEPLRGWPGIRGGYTPPELAFGGGVIIASGSLPGLWHEVVAVGTIEPQGESSSR
jgi:hypothetical protein